MQILLILAVALLQLGQALPQHSHLFIVLTLETALLQLAVSGLQLQLDLVQLFSQALLLTSFFVDLCLALLQLLLTALERFSGFLKLLLEGLYLIAVFFLLQLHRLVDLLYLVFVSEGLRANS